MLSLLPDDILINILGIHSPLSMINTCSVSRNFYDAFHAAHRPIEVNTGSDIASCVSFVREGSTLRIHGDHLISGKDIIVRTCLQLTGGKNACLRLYGGGRILWCAPGKITNIKIEREIEPYDNSPQFPDGILCVRGLGRLQVRFSSFQYTPKSLGFTAFGTHVDFGAVLTLKDVKFIDIPGPCIKIVNGRADVKRTFFLMVRHFPIIVACRGFVRVHKCTTLHPASTREYISLRHGANANITKGSHWSCRRTVM